jgi:hypothetical protein
MAMKSQEFRKPKRCATCGEGSYHRVERAGRYEEYNGATVEIPADTALLECSVCSEILMSPRDMEELAPILEAAHSQ